MKKKNISDFKYFFFWVGGKIELKWVLSTVTKRIGKVGELCCLQRRNICHKIRLKFVWEVACVLQVPFIGRKYSRGELG